MREKDNTYKHLTKTNELLFFNSFYLFISIILLYTHLNNTSRAIYKK